MLVYSHTALSSSSAVGTVSESVDDSIESIGYNFGGFLRPDAGVGEGGSRNYFDFMEMN